MILENDRSAPVIVQLDGGRAWIVAPGTWGPAVVTRPGTRATIYTFECTPIAEVEIKAGSRGFSLRPDGTIHEFAAADITVATVEHPGCE